MKIKKLITLITICTCFSINSFPASVVFAEEPELFEEEASEETETVSEESDGADPEDEECEVLEDEVDELEDEDYEDEEDEEDNRTSGTIKVIELQKDTYMNESGEFVDEWYTSTEMFYSFEDESFDDAVASLLSSSDNLTQNERDAILNNYSEDTSNINLCIKFYLNEDGTRILSSNLN